MEENYVDKSEIQGDVKVDEQESTDSTAIGWYKFLSAISVAAAESLVSGLVSFLANKTEMPSAAARTTSVI